MECIANYEIKSDLSVSENGKWLRLHHPDGLFKARIRNIERKDFSSPFLLSIQIRFEAVNLNDAVDVAEERLAELLNILALATGRRFVRHRIRQIVDCTPGSEMRSCLMWADAIDNEDPLPILDQEVANSINSLLHPNLPPVMKRALRWYRLGVNSLIPDDQFQCFWFALELLAVDQKSNIKVNDKCPRCKGPLFCSVCNIHPTHRPYDKHAIRDVIIGNLEENEHDLIAVLEKTRNALMHGSTLREIQRDLPDPHESIVDVLGRIVVKSIIKRFPVEVFNNKLSLRVPGTYVHRTIKGVVEVQTTVPVDKDGEFNLDFTGMTVSLSSNVPPQSAKSFFFLITKEQLNFLGKLRYQNGSGRDLVNRIWSGVQIQDETIAIEIVSTDMPVILKSLKDGVSESYVEVFKDIFIANNFEFSSTD